MEKRKAKRPFRALVITAAVLVLLAAVALYLDPYLGSTSWDGIRQPKPVKQELTREQALDDLAYLTSRIGARHYSAANGLPQAVRRQYDAEKANLPARPTVLDVWAASGRILRQLNDSHSSASYYTHGDRMRLQLRFVTTKGGLCCATDPYSGRKVLAIGGISTAELRSRYAALSSSDNPGWLDYIFSDDLRFQDVLLLLGADVSGSVSITFDEEGAAQTVSFPFGPKQGGAPAPDFVRYTIDPARSVGILTLDSCRPNRQYADTLKKFFTEAKAAGVRSVALDLRANGGGDSSVIGEFLRYLPADEYTGYGEKTRLGILTFGAGPSKRKIDRYAGLTFTGNVYVLTSSQTFSSAAQFAVVLRDNGLCRVVGQAPGSKPSAFGEVIVYQLPHSGIAFTLTFKQYLRPDGSKDAEPALTPDYPADVTAQGDGALDKLYEIIR